MEKYDANFGVRWTERRRFRVFLLIMLPLLGSLSLLVGLNPPEGSKLEILDQRAGFVDAKQEVCGANGMSAVVNIDEAGRPVPPPYIE